MNQERRSINEEVERSKDELQSLNQQLMTRHDQLEAKVRELVKTNDDPTNRLCSTYIATLFLDRRLRVWRYTPLTTRLIQLMPADIGRPFSEIARACDDPELLEDAHALLAGEQRPAREIEDHSGHWYLRRLHPYRSEHAPINGLAITFIEMTARKRAELALAESEGALRRVADAMPALIARVTPELRYSFHNAAYADWFGVPPESLRGTLVADLVGGQAFSVVREKLERALGDAAALFDDHLLKPAGRDALRSVLP